MHKLAAVVGAIDAVDAWFRYSSAVARTLGANVPCKKAETNDG